MARQKKRDEEKKSTSKEKARELKRSGANDGGPSAARAQLSVRAGARRRPAISRERAVAGGGGRQVSREEVGAVAERSGCVWVCV